ncbi:MAG TPA: alpha/beta hydrolase [Acidimicrobiia bacterium]|nr:alpha/beta hydrolase [Acidimicrobiia bacterium]
MPAVLVHGVPDTFRLWDALRAQLSRPDVVTPALPGFGAPLPEGFDASKEAYADWLIGEIEAIGEPVDLVGHDWGSILVQRIVSVRPDLIRTWAAGSGPVDRQYVWHDMAQMWQTPDVGEQVMTAMDPAALASFLEVELQSADLAQQCASRVDGPMKDCILALYRSAVNVGAEWADQVDTITTPGLVLWGESDAYVGPEYARRLGERTGARVVVFENTGHWWPVAQAEAAARELETLWGSIPG